jgi:hypothetical protein
LLSRFAEAILDLDLLHAVNDALREAETRSFSGPEETASAHEAAAALELWLRHVAWDFAAIDDLTPVDSAHFLPGPETLSPAQFSPDMREAEMQRWGGIAIRSYATVSPRPFRFEAGKAAPQWDMLRPWTWPDLTERSNESAGTDLVYRYCYRACAGGPFRLPAADIPVPRPFDAGQPRRIELWDNDGIVNTASMLWPSGGATRLVHCDHMDITGHFARLGAGGERRDRIFRAYDLLGSASQFDASHFAAVWNDIFDFCEAGEAVAAAAGACRGPV